MANEPDRAPAGEPPYEIMIVVLFSAVGLAVLAGILRHEPRTAQAGPIHTAYRPKDFAAILQVPPLPKEAFQGKPDDGTGFPVPPPPFSSEDIYPCMECHEDLEPNPKRRQLEMAHEEIHLRQGHKDRWCFDCHNPENRDVLRLADGTLVRFEESYRLCGQCHGTIYRDWRRGIHGRRWGWWNGPKSYLLCVHCHDPHAPRFKPRKPLPPPVPPEWLRQARPPAPAGGPGKGGRP